ncbi:hypothetical protein ES703_103201 [subsurface metagenome]
MTGERNSVDFILREYLSEKAFISVVKTHDGIPIKLEKGRIIRESSSMNNKNGLCLLVDMRENLGKLIFRKHAQVLDNEEVIVLFEERDRVKVI